jgi:sec-independent protein translocase protein TatC
MSPISAHDKRMELTEHLAELRTHIIKSIWYIILGAIIAYQFFNPIYGFFYRPLKKELSRLNAIRIKAEVAAQAADAPEHLRPFILNIPHALHDPPTREEFNELADTVAYIRTHPVTTPLMSTIFRSFWEPFMVKLKISMVVGLIMVLPLVVWELTKFILPALTPGERKPLRLLVPLSAFLLLSGITVAYITMFFAMGWFLSYLDEFPQPAILMQDPNDYILFLLKMMAAFGIAFQLPVVLMGMAYAGLVTSAGLLKQWRWGIVIAFLGGVFTPANDPMSWALMVIPLLVLYFGSFFLVRYVENVRARARAEGT